MSGERVAVAPSRTWTRLGLLAFLTHFVLFVPSVAPSIPGGHDSGEMLSNAIVLGIAHPPGYPLYTMLAHLWTYLPFGELAWRVNLFSAFTLSLAVGCLAVAFGRAARAPAAGFAAALLYGFSYTPWRQGVGAEVFSLHIFFCAALVLGCILWGDASDRGRRQVMYFGFIIFGLAAAHHHTIIFMVVPCFGYFAWTRGGSSRAWGFSLGALLLGLVLALAPYSYLYIRAKQDCPLNWGDPSNAQMFMDHVLRKGYGTGRLNPASGTVQRGGGAQAIGYFGSLVRNQFPFPLILIAVGGVLLSLRKPALLWLYGTIFFINGPGFALYSDQPPIEFFMDMVERFYCISYLGVAGFISLGLAWVEHQARGTRFARLVWLMPLLAVYSILMNWSACSQRGQYQPYDHMKAIMDYLPKDSVLLIDGDLPAGEWDFLHVVEGHRPDLLGVFPGLLSAHWYRRDWMNNGPHKGLGDDADRDLNEASKTSSKQLRHTQFLLDACRKRNIAVYATSKFGEAQDGYYIPEGLVYRYLNKDEVPPTARERAETAKKVLDYLNKAQRRGNYRMDLRLQSFWQRYTIGTWVRAYRDAARELYHYYPDLSEQALLKAVEMDPYSAKDQVNLALISMDRRDWATARERLDEALRLEPEMPLALGALVDLYRNQGDTEQAALWSQRLQERKSRGNF